MRSLLAIVGLLVGLWLFHEVSVYQGVLAARGQGDLATLLKDAPFLIRFAGALTFTLGSAVSLKWKWIGWFFVALGLAAHVLLVAAMVAMGADQSLWLDDAMLAGGLLVLSAALLTLRK